MTEIEAVYARHSVRAFLDKKIDVETAKKLEESIEGCNAASGLRLQFLPDAGNTFGRLLSRVMGLGSAPAVIACVGKDGPGLEERIGYWGERAVLAAQSLGLNTCWAGTFSPKGVPCGIAPGERLVIVIAVGYGKLHVEIEVVFFHKGGIASVYSVLDDFSGLFVDEQRFYVAI